MFSFLFPIPVTCSSSSSFRSSSSSDKVAKRERNREGLADLVLEFGAEAWGDSGDEGGLHLQ